MRAERCGTRLRAPSRATRDFVGRRVPSALVHFAPDVLYASGTDGNRSPVQFRTDDAVIYLGKPWLCFCSTTARAPKDSTDTTGIADGRRDAVVRS